MSSLKESLHGFLDTKEQTNASFKVTDDSSANWALRKIKQKQEQVERVNALVDEEVEKIEAWGNSENDKTLQDIDFFQSLLAKYAMQMKREDSNFKSLKLPNGRIGFRKQQPEWNYDNEKVVAALKSSERTDLIRIKEEPDKTAIKKTFVVDGDKVINSDTGEIVKGINIEHREDSFNVVVDK